jgi:hypothetical protein
VIEVPKGFVTDFASIPCLARLFQGPADKVGDAAIVHDWLYAVSKPEETSGPETGGVREFADRIFRSYLLETGISERRTNALFKAVQAGAQRAFDRCQTGSNCTDWLFADVAWQEEIPAPMTKEAARSALGRTVNKGCVGDEWKPTESSVLQRIQRVP